MTYKGKVKDGVVVFEKGASPPEGIEVEVQAIQQPERKPDEETLGQRLMKFAGIIPGLPSDMARNHDHYIHGTPRK